MTVQNCWAGKFSNAQWVSGRLAKNFDTKYNKFGAITNRVSGVGLVEPSLMSAECMRMHRKACGVNGIFRSGAKPLHNGATCHVYHDVPVQNVHLPILKFFVLVAMGFSGRFGEFHIFGKNSLFLNRDWLKLNNACWAMKLWYTTIHPSKQK